MSETTSKKPSLDELLLCIDDLYYLDSQLEAADWPLNLSYNKDTYLEKCRTAKRVFSAYLEDAPSLRGYLMSISYLENYFKKL